MKQASNNRTTRHRWPTLWGWVLLSGFLTTLTARSQTLPQALSRPVRPTPGTRPLGAVLAELSRQSRVPFCFSSSVVPVGRRCRLPASGGARPLAVVLHELLAAEHLAFGLAGGQLLLWPAGAWVPPGVVAVGGEAAAGRAAPASAGLIPKSPPAGAAGALKSGAATARLALGEKPGPEVSRTKWARDGRSAAVATTAGQPVRGAATGRSFPQRIQPQSPAAARGGQDLAVQQPRASARVPARLLPLRPGRALGRFSPPGFAKPRAKASATPPAVALHRAVPVASATSAPTATPVETTAQPGAAATPPAALPDSTASAPPVAALPADSAAVPLRPPARDRASAPSALAGFMGPRHLRGEAGTGETLRGRAVVEVGFQRAYLVGGLALADHQGGAWGLGLGTAGRARGRFTPSLDLVYWWVSSGSRDERNPSEDLLQLRPALAWQINAARRWQFVGGPTLNLVPVTHDGPSPRGGLGPGQGLRLDTGPGGLRLWPGFQVGVRF